MTAEVVFWARTDPKPWTFAVGEACNSYNGP